MNKPKMHSDQLPDLPIEPAKPGPEVHEEFGRHEAFWLVTSCGNEDHPTYWSCSICARKPGQP